ncbi:DUF1501 domain-containing protein [Primorskyibacter marinus]|uniref:DUF1501 domain-containing protein n=1 Tax=Primorskyibacter marinus TaxID=1977320 RepID=UPI000E302AD7|nr:DUF1501 domain-containing protein [Primorskyibacter marinus]
MSQRPLTRRAFLTRSAALGCSVAASPLLTPMTFAAAPGDNRLVVIILRGGMDGIGVVRPYGDPAYRALRGHHPMVSDTGPVDLDGFFAIHPALRPLMPLWHAGQLGFVHAVSTPYRDKRSHFDGQDLLEAGTPDLSQGLARDGWLNRMMTTMPGITARSAFAIGRDNMAILSGKTPVSNWSPDSDLQLSPQAMLLAEMVMAEDPLFSAALKEAYGLAGSDGDPVRSLASESEILAEMQQNMLAATRGGTETKIAEFAAQQLRGATRIASFSLNGWDTHSQQYKGLNKALGRLAQVILELKSGLGPVWDKTAVVAMTEFGRTVRLNGSNGTDHGTAGAMVMAGGAIRGGRVVTDWPGLEESALYKRRDLMPTRDVRAHAGWLMRELFGTSVRDLESTIFPGLEMGNNPRLVL